MTKLYVIIIVAIFTVASLLILFNDFRWLYIVPIITLIILSLDIIFYYTK